MSLTLREFQEVILADPTRMVVVSALAGLMGAVVVYALLRVLGKLLAFRVR